MRKVLLIGLLVVAFTLLLSATALANNGPHLGGAAPGSVDGGFGQETDACAGCHRAHTGVRVQLLKSGANTYSFCIACHNGTGANTNVQNGIFNTVPLDAVTKFEGGVSSMSHGEAGKGLNGGGFVDALPYNGLKSRGGISGATTSTHTVEGSPIGIAGTADGSGTAWGGGPTGPGTDFTLVAPLKCTSCHDPHGSKNGAPDIGGERYRILLNTVNGVSVGPIKSHEAEFGAKDYTKVQYKEGVSTFCVACHTQYKTPVGTIADPVAGTYITVPGGAAAVRYRHLVDAVLDDGNPLTPPKTGNGKTITENVKAHTNLPVDDPENNLYGGIGGAVTYTDTDKVVCLSCHQVHGTSATTTANSTLPPANSSTLLRMNNRGVCQDCHQR